MGFACTIKDITAHDKVYFGGADAPEFTGTVTLCDDGCIFFRKAPTSTVTIKAPAGKVGDLTEYREDTDFDINKIVSADGMEVELRDDNCIYFVCDHTSYTNGVCDACKTSCQHETITDGVCSECSSRFAAAVKMQSGTTTYFATVEEAVAEVNNNENAACLYFIEDYTGNIDLTIANANITLDSLSNTPASVTGDITINNVFAVHIKNIKINGSVTTDENASLIIHDGAYIKTLTTNFQLDFNGGSAETVNTYSFASFEGCTVGNLNAYHTRVFMKMQISQALLPLPKARI